MKNVIDIEASIAAMTLEEKASLLSGANHWDTKSVPRVGIPKLTMSDGPHGLRRQDNYEGDGTATTRTAVCYPTASALASSFDRDLLSKLGETLGDECQANDNQMLLGPGVNIKRSPLCGRNFEYFSEDPYLAGEVTAAYISGLQSKGVSACVKHFALNNQEFRRMSCDSVCDERTMREIYLPAFEAAVKKGGAKSVMCSYNRINGQYACENTSLLTDILRKEWGFDGMVVTDWGAMYRRDKALAAGLNLEMPSSGGVTDKQIVDAVRSGKLDMSVLDNSIREFLGWANWCLAQRSPTTVSLAEHHAFARELASRCAVLLKNDGNILPLDEKKKIAFLGIYAAETQYQGGGSSHINCYEVTNALDTASPWADIDYAPMFSDSGALGADEWQRGIDAAKAADAAVMFVALPSSVESECFDRDTMELPDYEVRAILDVASVNPNTVVVLYNGSPVAMPWADKVPAILEMYLGGEASGAATADLLFGKASPAGRLAETFPLRIEDTPAYPDYGKDYYTARYGEGIYVGYRHYDAKKLDVQFPFGHGLGYTTFEMSSPSVTGDIDHGFDVTVYVTNTGSRRGTETVQVYVGFDGKDHIGRAPREMRGFEKVELDPGETKSVTVTLTSRAFSYYETRISDFYAESGEYTIYIGRSSRDLPLKLKVNVKSPKLPLGEYGTLTLGDLLDYAETDEQKAIVAGLTGKLGGIIAGLANDDGTKMSREMIYSLPLHSLKSFSRVSDEDLRRAVEALR